MPTKSIKASPKLRKSIKLVRSLTRLIVITSTFITAGSFIITRSWIDQASNYLIFIILSSLPKKLYKKYLVNIVSSFE